MSDARFALSALAKLTREGTDPFIDLQRGTPGGGAIMFLDVVADAGEVADRRFRPADTHQPGYRLSILDLFRRNPARRGVPGSTHPADVSAGGPQISHCRKARRPAVKNIPRSADQYGMSYRAMVSKSLLGLMLCIFWLAGAVAQGQVVVSPANVNVTYVEGAALPRHRS